MKIKSLQVLIFIFLTSFYAITTYAQLCLPDGGGIPVVERSFTYEIALLQESFVSMAAQDAGADAALGIDGTTIPYATLKAAYAAATNAVAEGATGNDIMILFRGGVYTTDYTVYTPFEINITDPAMGGLLINAASPTLIDFMQAGFNEFIDIIGVDDIVINGVSAKGFSETDGSVYTFTDAQDIIVSNSIICENTGGPAVAVESTARDTRIRFVNCELNDHTHFPSETAMIIRSRSSNGAVNTYVDFVNTSFSGNTRNKSGGALEINNLRGSIGPGPVVNFEGGFFRGNAGLGGACDGGAVFISGNSMVTFNGTEFYNNTSSSVVGTTGGGAIAIHRESTVTINGGIYENNNSHQYGGAILIVGYSNVVSINNTIFKGNSAQRGAAIDIDGGYSTHSQVDIDNCLFYENVVSGSDPYKHQGTIYINAERYGAGSAVNTRITNTTIANNTRDSTSGSETAGIYLYGSRNNIDTDPNSDVLIIDNCILWGNTGRDLYEVIIAGFLEAEDPSVVLLGTNTIELGESNKGDIYTQGSDPMFTDPANGNYFSTVGTNGYLGGQLITCLAQDSLQLLKIYTATNGQNWDTLWNLSNPFSTWHGITLTPDGCNVEGINFGFYGNGLTGVFPSLDLGELKTLNLIRNELTGVESLEDLPSLEFLELSNNQLTVLPSLEGLQNLENLYLANNQLVSVPDYSNLSKLKRLSLFNNQLKEVPDYSGLALLERLAIYDNQMTIIPSYDGLGNLTHLSINDNRLDFSDISPNGANFDYAPQDSIALAYQGGNLVFNVGGNLADNTYTWFIDSVAQAPITGDNSFATTGAGQYRCEVTNSQLPDLTLYSNEINICGSSASSPFSLYDLNTVFPPFCYGENLNYRVFGPLQKRYRFFVNGQLVQDDTSPIYTANNFSRGDILHAIVEDEQGCQYITDGIEIDMLPEIDLVICQDDPTQFNAKLRQGSPPWSFKLTEYNSGWHIKDSIYNLAVTSINISRNPNSSYEITEVTDDNCRITETIKIPKILGCGTICVGFSEPQIEYYTAQFFKPVCPESFTWTITPQAAIDVGDVEIIGVTNDAALQLNFPNALPTYPQILLTVTAETACGTEVQEYELLLDSDCVWPGDVNRDGNVATTAPNRPWVNDAIGLIKGISVVQAINRGNDNEVLHNFKRPRNCLADKPYDWIPQSARDWAFEATNTSLGSVFFQYMDNAGNVTSSHNLKYADADGNGSLEDEPFWDTFTADFDTLSQYSDFDVIAYNEHLGKTHDGNSHSYKTQAELPELIHITVADSVLASGDEVVFIATLGSLDNVIDSVIQVAFQADASFGTYKRPAIDVSSSHLGPNDYLNNSYKVDYPFVIPNWEGAEDSLQWLVSMHSPDFAPVSFAGEELCSAKCYVVVVGAFTEDNPQPKNKNSNLGVARIFKVTAGIHLANGRVVYAQSNEVTIYIQPDPHLSARILLEGPFDTATGLMHDELRQKHLIPDSEPYSVLEGTEYFPKEELKGIGMTDGMAVLSVTGQEAIVDWVLIEVWQDSSLYCRRPALLTRSGNVVDVDGFSPVPMTRVPYGDYDLVIRHRNHLPVKTTAPVSLQRGILALDFTTIPAGQKEIAPNLYACCAGDASCGQHNCIGGYNVNAEDKAYWYGQNGLYLIYDNADFDMNSDVNGIDRLLWEGNNGTFLGIPR